MCVRVQPLSARLLTPVPLQTEGEKQQAAKAAEKGGFQFH